MQNKKGSHRSIPNVQFHLYEVQDQLNLDHSEGSPSNAYLPGEELKNDSISDSGMVAW